MNNFEIDTKHLFIPGAWKQLIPRQLSVPELKQELKKRGLSTRGNKDILIKRLDGNLAELWWWKLISFFICLKMFFVRTRFYPFTPRSD